MQIEDEECWRQKRQKRRNRKHTPMNHSQHELTTDKRNSFEIPLRQNTSSFVQFTLSLHSSQFSNYIYIYPLFIYTLVDGYLSSHRYLPSGISHSFIKGEYISSCSSFLSISTNCKQSLRFRVVLRINEMDDSLSHLLLFFDVSVRDQFREFLFINII